MRIAFLIKNGNHLFTEITHIVDDLHMSSLHRDEAVQKVITDAPDVVALHDNVWSTSKIVPIIRAISPRTRVIAVVNTADEAVEAIKKGATSYEYVKNFDQLSQTVHEALQNRTVIDDEVAQRILKMKPRPRNSILSPRELEILSHLARKVEHRLIEGEFHISKDNLPYHMGTITLKIANSMHVKTDREIRNYLRSELRSEHTWDVWKMDRHDRGGTRLPNKLFSWLGKLLRPLFYLPIYAFSLQNTLEWGKSSSRRNDVLLIQGTLSDIA
jgi:DNA-binding NarL/FixJ family response regulator